MIKCLFDSAVEKMIMYELILVKSEMNYRIKVKSEMNVKWFVFVHIFVQVC